MGPSMKQQPQRGRRSEPSRVWQTQSRASPGHVLCLRLSWSDCRAFSYQLLGPMTHTLSVLLCLDTLPRPSLKAENGPLVPLGTSVTLRCRGGWEGDEYRLEKWEEYGRQRIMDMKSNEMEGEFLMPSVTAEHAGTYYCLYEHSSHWSDRSDPLQLVVTGLYDPPSLSALPSSQVASGHNVTLQCQSEDGNDRFALYKDGEQITQGRAQPHGRGSLANFSIPAVSAIHGRTYQCYIFHSYRPYEWSAPSNPLVLRVTGTFSPSPESGSTQFGLAAGILIGVSAFLILISLFLLLLLCHRCHRHQARLRNGGREAEVRKTTRSSDPAGTSLEETPYAAVNDDRQTEEARQEDIAVSHSHISPSGGNREAEASPKPHAAGKVQGPFPSSALLSHVPLHPSISSCQAPKREDPQEVTYAQLNPNSFKAGAKDPPPSGPVEPSLYATLR
ncbi:leukocyte immunoglobulin-like receptor subfamily A member 5 isoform X2 [Phascolarctos cinereus]